MYRVKHGQHVFNGCLFENRIVACAGNVGAARHHGLKDSAHVLPDALRVLLHERMMRVNGTIEDYLVTKLGFQPGQVHTAARRLNGVQAVNASANHHGNQLIHTPAAMQLSFQAVPVAGGIFQTSAVQKIMDLSSNIFIVAVKIASTTFAALFLTSVVMAVIARLVPQMNVFIVGFPLKISVGFIMMFISLPFFMYAFGKMFTLFQKEVISLIALLR